MIGVRNAAMSRFRSGQGTINISSLEILFEVARPEIVTKEDLEGFEHVIAFIANIWNRKRRFERVEIGFSAGFLLISA